MRIQLLGRLQVTHDAVTLTHRLRPRAQRLLVYLLLQRQTSLPRESVAFTLWPDQPERDALGALRRALSDIRASLPHEGEEWISAVGGALRWNTASPYWLDVEEFERLTAQATPATLHNAVSLYQGDLLMDWDEEWALAPRERLRQQQSQALRQLVAYHRSRGAYTPALTLARQALTLDPFAEASYRDLITLLYESGDRAAALAEYDRLSALLRDELGVAPMPETQSLRAAITRGERLLPAAARAGADLRQERLPVRSALVGRAVEMARLNALWAQAVAGQGSCVIISGEAGIGKSRLAQALVDDVIRGGGLALVGYSYEFERALPYQPLVDMLRSVAPVLPRDELAPAYVAALTRLAPEIFNTPGGAAVIETASDEARTRLFEALLQAFLALARRQPVLLLFEDVHWAAEATLDWLTYITPRISASRLLVAMTYRTDEVGSEHAVVRLGRRFTREGVVLRLALHPLSREAHRELVAQMSGLTGEQAVMVADRLFRETAGHPFFLHELARGLIDAGQITVDDDAWTGAFVEAGPEVHIVFPDSLRAIVNERVDRMSARARLFLKTAAVVGRVFPYQLLLRAGDWTDEVALEAMEEVLARGFIRPGATEGEFVFAHHLLQEAIYAGLTAPRRAYLHRLVAQALVQAAERQGPSARPALAGAIVHHALRSENDRLIFHWAHLAAEHAASLHAYADALNALDAASTALDRLRHDPDFDLEAGERQHIQILLDRAELMMPVGRPMEEYGPVVHAIGDLLVRYPDDLLYARYCLQRAAYLSWLSQYEPAAQAALEAHACLMKLGDQLRAARSLVIAARYKATISQCRAARQLLEQALGLAQAVGNTAVETQCEIGLAWVSFNQGDVQTALQHLAQALALCEQSGDKRAVAHTYNILATAWSYYHHADQAQVYAEKSAQLYRQMGYAQTAYRPMLCVADAHHMRGALTLARPIYEQVWAEAQAHSDSWLAGWAAHNLGRVALAQGDFAEAEQRLQYAYQLRLKTGELHNQVSDLTWLGHLRLAQGDAPAALEYTSRAVNQLEALRGEVYVWETPDVLMTHAQALRAVGDAQDAHAYLHHAYNSLMAFAAQIEDRAVRDVFLAYPLNARIIAAWEARDP